MNGLSYNTFEKLSDEGKRLVRILFHSYIMKRKDENGFNEPVIKIDKDTIPTFPDPYEEALETFLKTYAEESSLDELDETTRREKENFFYRKYNQFLKESDQKMVELLNQIGVEEVFTFGALRRIQHLSFGLETDASQPVSFHEFLSKLPSADSRVFRNLVNTPNSDQDEIGVKEHQAGMVVAATLTEQIKELLSTMVDTIKIEKDVFRLYNEIHQRRLSERGLQMYKNRLH